MATKRAHQRYGRKKGPPVRSRGSNSLLVRNLRTKLSRHVEKHRSAIGGKEANWPGPAGLLLLVVLGLESSLA